MLKIRKDNKEMIVSQGSYDNLYKSLGYEIVSGRKEEVTPVKEVAPSEPVKDTINEVKPTESNNKYNKKEDK